MSRPGSGRLTPPHLGDDPTVRSSNPRNNARPHESSLGEFPKMESAPSSGNFALNVATHATITTAGMDPLPPPPPRPKTRTRSPPPPSRASHATTTSTASLGMMAAASSPLPLPPPPVVKGTYVSTPPRNSTPPSAPPVWPPPPPQQMGTHNPTPPVPTTAILPPPPPPQRSPFTPTMVVDPPALADAITPTKTIPSLDYSHQPATEEEEEVLPPPRVPLMRFWDPMPALESDKASFLLARRQTHIPILVIATESANRLAWKNGLQLVDLFQGLVKELKFSSNATLPPFRSINRSLFPSDLPVEFVDPERLGPYAYDEAHALLQEHAKLQESDGNLSQELILLEDRVEELLQEPTKVEADQELPEVSKSAYQLTSPLDIPWLIRYRRALDASTNGLPHDLIQCPPLILLVCSTQEVEPPLQVLQELYNSPNVFLPTCFRNGLYDPHTVRKEVLVLHDNLSAPPIDEAYLRLNLQKLFGPQAQILKLNNVPTGMAQALAAEETTDLWGGGGKLGCRLSDNDKALLRRYFTNLLVHSLMPSLERRIAHLHAIVNERKKGVRNLVKSFWRKPKDSEDGSSTQASWQSSGHFGPGKPLQPEVALVSEPGGVVVKYPFDSIESQTRLLADTLFLMKDFEAALSIYRLIRDDFRSDKALTYYANVQEMMALCMYHTDPFLRSKEIFTCLETALLSYTRAAEEERAQMVAGGGANVNARPSTAPHATRLATRLCLLLATASEHLTRGRELEVADLLASASSHESSLGAAVLLEQSSAFYYEAGLHRKYAFHMLMSGHMFRTAGQDHHAFRCFTSALYVYKHGRWAELHNHLKSALAAQLYSMGRMSVALIIYAKLVAAAGKVSVKSQQKFLIHLLEICAEHPKKALAGADRMGAGYLPTAREREAARNARLDRIVGVVQYNHRASRVLEIPHMNLPSIQDSSVRIWTHAEEHFLPTTSSGAEEAEAPTRKSPAVHFGTLSKGEDAVWEDLEMVATAEWKATESTEGGLDETIAATLSRIENPEHRKVIAHIDKLKQTRSLIERSKRNGSLKPKPSVRARGEPIFCDFVMQNPLKVDIRVTQLQLVARLVEEESETLCTCEDAVQVGPKPDGEKKTWTFASTEDQEFLVPDFARTTERGQRTCQPAGENPFFVVTKHNLDLGSEEERVISVGLTPLVTGDLEILGVRCKLSDQVWVYHPFHIPGPLLNDTRSNRANRVRGDSLVLKSKIEVDMPCLTAELLKRVPMAQPLVPTDDGPLLEGQISSWTIRLRNVGNAPATQPALKTNFPWVNIVSSDKKGISMEDLEGRATSKCLGATGTFMTLPCEGGQLKQASVIQPGESVDIPIQIRTSGNGKQQFYMLYRYELQDDTSQSSRTRWLRRMYEVPVFPALAISSRILTSPTADNEHILSVELTNNRTDRPTDLFVTLDKLALASRHYRLEILPGQFTTSDQVANVLQIGWQERMTVHYRVLPLEDESRTCLLSECPFLEDGDVSIAECIKSDGMDFLCLVWAAETFENAWKAHQNDLARAESAQDGEGQHPRSIASIRRANTVISSSSPDVNGSSAVCHPTSIGMLCPSGKSSSMIHILCNWRAILGDEVIRGEQHMRGVTVRPRAYCRGCPLSATASYESRLRHDFSKGPALVPLRVKVRNQLLEAAVKFYVSVEDHPNYDLIGLDMLRLTLEASGCTTIPFDVLIPRAGIHDLQFLRLTIRDGEEELEFPLTQQWLINIEDTPS